MVDFAPRDGLDMDKAIRESEKELQKLFRKFPDLRSVVVPEARARDGYFLYGKAGRAA